MHSFCSRITNRESRKKTVLSLVNYVFSKTNSKCPLQSNLMLDILIMLTSFTPHFFPVEERNTSTLKDTFRDEDKGGLPYT